MLQRLMQVILPTHPHWLPICFFNTRILKANAIVRVPGPLLGRQASAPAVIDTSSAYTLYQDVESEIQQSYRVLESEEFSDEESTTALQRGRMEEHLTKYSL